MATNTQNVIRYECEVSRETNKDGKRIDTRPLHVTFDFTGVTQSQLMNEAIRNIVVKMQGKARAATTRKDKPLKWIDAVNTFHGKTVKVADFLKDTRSRKSPEQRRAALVKDAAKLDEAARRALIAELSKGLKS